MTLELQPLKFYFEGCQSSTQLFVSLLMRSQIKETNKRTNLGDLGIDFQHNKSSSREVFQYNSLKCVTVADPEGDAPTPREGALTYYLAKFLLKTAWK